MSKYPGRIVSNLAPAGYSVFFDGTGDYLSVANNAALQFGSGDFTIEFWWYPNVTSDQNLISKWNSSTEWILQWRSAGNFRWAANGSVVRDANYTLSTGAWIHVAVSCASTNLRIFVNGAQIGTTATQSSITNTSEAVTIGAGQISSTPLAVNGYISNVRIVKGTALYTAAFTPPTQLFPVTNTSLLTCQSPTIIDNSSNAFAITANGNAAVSTFTPFTAYVPYNPALGASTPGVWTLDEALQAAATRQWNMYDPSFNLTTLLLHGNGTNGAQNNTFLDSSTNNFTITRNGNTTQGTFTPFSQGWSNYFGGSDALTIPSTSTLAFGTGDFCVEFWLYRTTSATGGLFSNSTGAGGGDAQFEIQLQSSTAFVSLLGWNTVFMTGTTAINPNTWYHIAVVRSGTSMAIFVNGIRDATATSANNFSSTNGFNIARQATGTGFITGYFSNLRAVKGSSVYGPSSSTITVPTAPLTNITNTSLLTCQSNRFVDNGTANSGSGFTISTAGTPSVQPFSPFLPTVAYTPQTIGGSGFFDGTGDWLDIASNAAFGYGTGDFTIEFWAYFTSISASTPNLIDQRNATTTQLAPTVYLDNGTLRYYTNGAIRITGNALVANTWYHIALCRSGTSTRMFVNGAQVGSTYADSNNYITSPVRIFASNDGATTVAQAGYMAGLRILKGTAQYTAAFTPPTAPPTAVTNTSLLSNFTNAGVVDSTAKNALETVGNAQISTTQSKFGGTSMSFNGTNSTLILRNSQLMNLGASDFTLEFWMYRSAATASQPLYSLNGSSQTNVLALDMGAAGGLGAYATASGGGTWSILNGQSFGTVPLTTWTHIALVRNGSTWRGYLNGVVGFTITNSSALASFDGLSIGSSGASTLWFNGFIDDFRITRFARYTAAFTPQTSQWQDQ